MYVRWATAGKMEVHFVGIQSVDKPDASHITKAMCLKMETVSGSEDVTGQWLQSNWEHVSQFSGNRSHILGKHCMSHQLELAYSDAASHNNLARKVDDLLSGLNSFYRKSCMNQTVPTSLL